MKVPGYPGWFVQHKIKGRKYWYYHIWDPIKKKQTSKRMDPPKEYLEQAGTNGDEELPVTPNTEAASCEIIKEGAKSLLEVFNLLVENQVTRKAIIALSEQHSEAFTKIKAMEAHL